ncbi:MAG: relaxase domain-containing protein, partial [Propionibacterium sp.]|nr:relaxase domain-containing protein [Propionibacterium sp.]
MTASVHKLTAGCGYDYLTRQVAAHDTTEKGHATLASYYSERGETPGTWYGRGLTGLGDLAVGDEVTQEQMQALFAHGHHPNMKARLAGLPAGASTELVEHATLLGQPFKTFEAATQFRLEGEKRSTRWRASQGLAPTAPVPVEVRAEIVNRLAEERFQERIGRAPTAGELAAEVARWSRSPTTACAGYDITFTPVKSVSTLWAIAPKP